MSEARYAAAGVDLVQADEAKARINTLVQSTRTSLSVGAIGAFGGMVRLPAGMRSPVLVMSTDGVGTKVLVAQQAGRHDTVGEDLVNHSVNDILVHGAQPIAFMDYIAGHRLPVTMIEGVVDGIARGCRAHGMPLAGGETAQMPGLYAAETFDLAGTIIGVVEEDRAMHGAAIAPGDVLRTWVHRPAHQRVHFGAPGAVRHNGSGPRRLGARNRYFRGRCAACGASQLRHRPAPRDAPSPWPCAYHRWRDRREPGTRVARWLRGRDRHRYLGLAATVHGDRAWGDVSVAEMREVFNLGVGMIAAVPPDAVTVVEAASAASGVPTWICGEVRAGGHGVHFT